MQQCAKLFKDDEQYKNDERYINIWIKFVSAILCITMYFYYIISLVKVS